MKTLYYIHDPMCSWCYGFSSTLTQLINSLPGDIAFERLLGGLAPDTVEPMSDEMQASIRSNWQRIEQAIAGVSFNYDFWHECVPRRSTYMSCRAVIAAREQGKQYDELMTSAIQQAYYQQAKNPSDIDTLVELAAHLGLDKEKFSNSLLSDATEEKLQREIMKSSSLGVASYPDLRLDIDGTIWPIAVDYTDADSMLESIDSLANTP